MSDHDGIKLSLATLPPTSHGGRGHQISLWYDPATQIGRVQDHQETIRFARVVKVTYTTTNSGEREHREELLNQAELPLHHLQELLTRMQEGYRFHFVFQPDRQVWQAELREFTQGASYNTVVYSHWSIRLVLDLVNGLAEYESSTYTDTST
jgi:hypothetical protein